MVQLMGPQLCSSLFHLKTKVIAGESDQTNPSFPPENAASASISRSVTIEANRGIKRFEGTEVCSINETEKFVVGTQWNCRDLGSRTQDVAFSMAKVHQRGPAEVVSPYCKPHSTMQEPELVSESTVSTRKQSESTEGNLRELIEVASPVLPTVAPFSSIQPCGQAVAGHKLDRQQILFRQDISIPETTVLAQEAQKQLHIICESHDVENQSILPPQTEISAAFSGASRRALIGHIFELRALLAKAQNQVRSGCCIWLKIKEISVNDDGSPNRVLSATLWFVSHLHILVAFHRSPGTSSSALEGTLQSSLLERS